MTRNILLTITFVVFCILTSKGQLTYQPDKISREYVNLYDLGDSLIKSNVSIKAVKLEGERCSSFLGSYTDWTNTNKYIWVRFRDKLDTELNRYLYRVTDPKLEAFEVELAVHHFEHKQYLFFNPKGCFYRFHYELYFYENGERYSYFYENSEKIEDVKSSEEVLSSVKQSLTKLLKNTSKEDFQRTDE